MLELYLIVFMERPFIGLGKEHFVISSRKSGWVLKQPNRWYAFVIACHSALKGQRSSETIRDDFCEATKRIDGIHIQIPQTRVFGLKRFGYIIAQRFIEEDYSIPSPQLFAKAYDMPFVADAADSNPNNFISKNSVLYWIDPNKGPLCRALVNSKLLSWEKYMSAKLFLKKAVRTPRGC